MDILDDLLNQLRDTTIRNTAQICDQRDEIGTVVGEVRKLASKAETRALARELETHRATLQLCARVAVVDMVRDLSCVACACSVVLRNGMADTDLGCDMTLPLHVIRQQ